jgi:alkylation response protein AidB-like acyl-CoA dehydrogenase
MTTEEIRSPLYTAKELAPTIRSCADQIEADRELPRPLFEALADAGFFKLMIPRVIGGAEIYLPTTSMCSKNSVKPTRAPPGWSTSVRFSRPMRLACRAMSPG